LGPLYTVYKAASAVRLAQDLERETGTPVVPMFWLQTEDHDLLEIAQSVVPRSSGEPPLFLTPEVPDENRISIAHLTLPDSVGPCVEQLALELWQLPRAQEHVERIKRYYRPGRSWTEAFANLLADLFEPTGLLVVDPRDPALARESAWVHRRALERAPELERLLLEQERALEAAGFESSVHVREGSPLSFYHPEAAHGPRTRLLRDGDDYVELRGRARHTLPDLLGTLERDPLRFSTSALLRPIVQDALLPTAAYVAGPAELAYFAQLPPLYAAFDLPQALIAPRARIQLIEPKAARLLTRLGLPASALRASERELLLRLAPDDEAALPNPQHIEYTLRQGFERTLRDALATLPPDIARGLSRSFDKTRDKLARSAGKLTDRYKLLVAQRDRERVEAVRQLKHLLYPEGTAQERVFGVSYYAARHGERALIERILGAIDVRACRVTELPL